MFYTKFKEQLVEYLKDDWIFIQRRKIRKQKIPFEPTSLILLQFSLKNNPLRLEEIYEELLVYAQRYRTSSGLKYFPSGYTWIWPENPYHYPGFVVIYKDFVNVQPKTAYFAILSTSHPKGSLEDLEEIRKHKSLAPFLLKHELFPIEYAPEGPLFHAKLPPLQMLANLVMSTKLSYLTLLFKTWTTFFGITSITGYVKLPFYWVFINILTFFVTCLNIFKQKFKAKKKSDS